MKIETLKVEITRYKTQKILKRKHGDEQIIQHKKDDRIGVLEAYLEQENGEIFSYRRFYDYAALKHGEPWAKDSVSEQVLAKEKSFLGQLFQSWKSPLSSLEKLPRPCRTDVINTYLGPQDISSMARVTYLIAQETKKSTHYKYWENGYKWKAKLIAIGCKKKPLDVVFNTMYIKDPAHLYDVMSYQGTARKAYFQASAFYLFSGELGAITHAISHYQLTDKTQPVYGESPWHLVILSGNYRAAALVPQKMKIDFLSLTAAEHTPLHLAAWSGNTSQIEYIRLFIHQWGLFFTPQSKDYYRREAVWYVDRYHQDKKDALSHALSKPLHEIDVEQFVDDDNKPLFNRSKL